MQVLTQLSELEDRIIQRLGNYSRPVKTKHLAERLKIDRLDLVSSLNNLRRLKLVRYTKNENNQSDSRGREELNYGWEIIKA